MRAIGVKTRKYTWALNVLKVTSFLISIFLAPLVPCILSLPLLFCTAVLEAMLDQSGQMLRREERERERAGQIEKCKRQKERSPPKFGGWGSRGRERERAQESITYRERLGLRVSVVCAKNPSNSSWVYFYNSSFIPSFV